MHLNALCGINVMCSLILYDIHRIALDARKLQPMLHEDTVSYHVHFKCFILLIFSFEKSEFNVTG